MFEGNSNAIPIDGFNLDHFGCCLANRLFTPPFMVMNHLAIGARPCNSTFTWWSFVTSTS